MSELDPDVIFTYIATQIPKDLHPHVLVVGSVAAAYQYRGSLERFAVNTKDADVVVQPAGAIDQCRTIANRLLAEGWRRREGCIARSSRADLEENDVIRLLPPERDNRDLYFVELLGFPRQDQTDPKELLQVELSDGWNVLPAFRHLKVVAIDQRTSDHGLRYAAPEMMGLANLLAHRTLGDRKTTEPVGERRLLRSAKDLGRVLALAELAGRDAVERWPEAWAEALRECYRPDEVAELGAHAGDGIRELLGHREALDDAHHAIDIGLLAGFGLTPDGVRAIGDRMLVDALEPLVELTRPGRG